MGHFINELKKRRIESKVNRAESSAIKRLDYRPIRELVDRGSAFVSFIADKALRQDRSNVLTNLLYCLATAEKHQEIARDLMDRVLSAAADDIWERLDTEELRILATLSSSSKPDLSRYCQLLARFNQAQLKSVEPDPSDAAYRAWLHSWIVSEFSLLEKRYEPSAVARFLAGCPTAMSMVVERAESFLAKQPRLTLVYAIALARNDSSLAISVLRSVLELPPGKVIWEYVDVAELKPLTEVLFRREPGLFEALASKLSDEQFAAARPAENDSSYVLWLQLALSRGFLWTEVSEKLRNLSLSWPEPQDVLDSIGNATAGQLIQDIEKNLTQALDSGNTSSPRIEGLLRQLSQLYLHYRLVPKPSLLASISSKLGQITIQACTPAATILQYDASTSWVPGLRDAWYRIEKASRLLRENPSIVVPPDLVLAAFALGPALGVCAGKDPSLQNFVRDTELLAPVRQLLKQLEPLQREYNTLVDKYREVVLPEEIRDAPEQVRQMLETQFQFYRSINAPHIHQLQRELKEYRQEIERLHHQIQLGLDRVRHDLSAGHLLLNVLNNHQQYPVGIRQAAAVGLELLAEHGYLDDQSKETIDAAIVGALAGDEGKLFRERHVFLPVNCNRTELTYALLEGLRWVENMIVEDVSAPIPESTASPVPLDPAVIPMMFDSVPGVLKFLEKYPLRLMQRDDQTRLLGLYAQTGGEIERWTRYEPPLNVGKVLLRYYQLNDRSTPNSMGIDYRLFSHPLLVLPVLFHEYLHHAGVPEENNRPIANEAEVRLREALFTRGLIALMAPTDDSQLEDYEHSLVEVLHKTDMDIVLFLVLSDLSDFGVLQRLNALVYNTYGGGADPVSATQRVRRQLTEEIFETHRLNITQTWDSQVKWPLPGAEGTEPLFEQFRSIRMRCAMQINTVQADQLPRILYGVSSQRDRDRWERYCSRSGSLSVLRQAAAKSAFVGTSWLDLILGKGSSAEEGLNSTDASSPDGDTPSGPVAA